jgi:uncharacterized protein (DUF486 family)
MKTVFLLILSNVFMTVAWYGHLKFKDRALLVVILLSWLIALPEYALQVPANRLGHGRFTAPQLKIIQEAISITVFIVFSIVYLKEMPNWRAAAAFVLIFAGVALAMTGRDEGAKPQAALTDGPVLPQDGEGPGHVRG